jgi:hypothetical protein
MAEAAAESVLDKVIVEPLETVFDSVGMMQGDSAPLKRAAVGAALGYGINYFLKPSFAYDARGQPKQFYFTADDKEKSNSTYFPYWAVVALPAIIFGVLI